MADRYWFDQQQPAYVYGFYGQPASGGPPAAGHQHGNPHQQNEAPFQQLAPGQPFYGQQAFDAAFSYDQYGAAAAPYGHPAGFMGHNGCGAAYMAAPHDMQQQQHQQHQQHQQQQDPFASGHLHPTQAPPFHAAMTPAAFPPALQPSRPSRALRTEKPPSAEPSPVKQVLPRPTPQPRSPAPPRPAMQPRQAVPMQPTAQPRPAMQARQAAPTQPPAQQRLGGSVRPTAQPRTSHAVKIVAPAPAPLKAAAQLAASYASVREPSPLTPDPFSRASYALPVKVRRPTAVAPEAAARCGHRVAAPSSLSSRAAGNGLPAAQTAAANALAAAGTAARKSDTLPGHQLPAVRTAVLIAPASEHPQPGILAGLSPVAPAFVPPSEKGAAGATQRRGPKNGMDGVTPKATMSATAPAFEPSRAPAPDLAADLGDWAALADIQFGDFSALSEPVGTAASAVGPAKAAPASTSQSPQDVSATTAASAAGTGAAASGRPPLRSASTISDASSESAKLTASVPHPAVRSQPLAKGKPPRPATTPNLDGPVSPVPSQSSKALLRVVSELSSVAESGADGIREGTAAPAAVDSPPLASAKDSALPALPVADSTPGRTDTAAQSPTPSGKSEQPTGGDAPAEVSGPDSPAASPALATAESVGSRVLSFGDFSPRAISNITTVGFLTDPLVAFLGPAAAQLPGSLSFAIPVIQTAAQPAASVCSDFAASKAAPSTGACSQGGKMHQSTATGSEAAALRAVYSNGIHLPVTYVNSTNSPHSSGVPLAPSASASDAAGSNDIQPLQPPVRGESSARSTVAVLPSQTEPRTEIPSEEGPEVVGLTASMALPVPAEPALEAAAAPVTSGQTEAPTSKAAASPPLANVAAGTGSPGQWDDNDAAKSPAARELIKAVRLPAASPDAGEHAEAVQTAAAEGAAVQPTAVAANSEAGSIAPQAEPTKRSVSPAVAYDEYEHSVFDEESDKDEEEEEEDEYDEEEGFDSNEANWARKEALRKGKVLAKGGTHADLTVKQKKQATAARVAYKPAPRWPASPGSVGSDTSEGSGVRDGGPPNPAPPAWNGNSKPASDPCNGGSAGRKGIPPQPPRTKGLSWKEAAAAAAAAAIEEAKERQRAQAAAIRMSLAHSGGVRPPWLPPSRAKPAKGSTPFPPLPRRADERDPSPQRSPAASPLAPPDSSSAHMPAWQLPAAALEPPRPPPRLPPLARQKGSPVSPAASLQDGAVQRQTDPSALPSTPPTVSSMQTGPSAVPPVPSPAFPAQHLAGLSGSQHGLPGAGSLQHHVESATKSPPVPPASALQRRMGPSGSPPMPTWDPPKPTPAAHSPSSAAATAAIPAAPLVVGSHSPAPTAPLSQLAPETEAAQDEDFVSGLLAVLLAPVDMPSAVMP